MAANSPLNYLENLLTHEHGLVDEVNETHAAKKLCDVRTRLLEHVREVSRSGDLALIVATEKAIVRGDLTRYANSPAMASSLKNALAEINAIERLIGKVNDPARYQEVDQAFSLPKNRKAGVPNDEARQAFRSHFARLSNMDKSRLTDEEKKLIDARKSAVFTAEKLYIGLQRKALGLGPEQSRSRGRGR